VIFTGGHAVGATKTLYDHNTSPRPQTSSNGAFAIKRPVGRTIYC
jgi:hypothetical protein